MKRPRLHTILTLVALAGTPVVVQAQPANDACAGAQVVTPNGTCYTGTTVAATDGWVGSVGCAGNNPEVWYSFVATGPVVDFTVSNLTMGGNVEIVLVSALLPCAGLVLEGSACGPSPLNATISYSLVVGATYYYTISSTGATGTFTTCVTTYNTPPAPGFDCTTAEALCTSSGFSQGNFTGIGAVEELSLNSCFGLDERQSKWYTFTCSRSGTFQLLVNPVNYVAATQTGDDYDFALWNVTTGCYSSANILAAPVACNWSGCVGSTGIAPTAPFMGQVAGTDYQNNNPPGPGDCLSNQQWVTTAVNLVACNRYALLIDNYTTSSSGFSVQFGGTAVMGPSAQFTYSLSSNCRTITVARGAYCTSSAMNYQWNFGDGYTSTAGVPGAHTYAIDGLYTVSLQVSDANGCVDTYSYQVNIGCLPLPIELLGLEGRAVNDGVLLEWRTASESDNRHFVVERSTDNELFLDVGVVDGAGTSTTERAYSFMDHPSMDGVLYYRLRQVDLDGTNTRSQAVSVMLQRTFGGLRVAPVPAQGQCRVDLVSYTAGMAELVLYDGQGRSVRTMNVAVQQGPVSVQVPLHGLDPGLYAVRVYLAGSVSGARLVVE